MRINAILELRYQSPQTKQKNFLWLFVWLVILAAKIRRNCIKLKISNAYTCSMLSGLLVMVYCLGCTKNNINVVTTINISNTVLIQCLKQS